MEPVAPAPTPTPTPPARSTRALTALLLGVLAGVTAGTLWGLWQTWREVDQTLHGGRDGLLVAIFAAPVIFCIYVLKGAGVGLGAGLAGGGLVAGALALVGRAARGSDTAA